MRRRWSLEWWFDGTTRLFHPASTPKTLKLEKNPKGAAAGKKGWSQGSEKGK
jgi:hypothetical protein